MKKLTLVFMLTFLLPLFAFGDDLIPSNSIGQERQEAEEGYYLKRINEDKVLLIKDNTIVKTIEYSKEDKFNIRTETEINGGKLVFKYDDRGNLVSYEENGETETLVYDASSHLISSSSKNKDGEVVRSRTYYRDPQNGSILAIKDNDNFSFYSETDNSSLLVVGNDDNFETYETFFGSITYRMSKDEGSSDYSLSEDSDGNLTISYDNGKITYSKEGRVIEDNGKKYFYHDNGVLDYTEEDVKDTTIKEYYEDATVVRREESDKNRGLVKKYTYSPNEVKLELYEKNKPYAIVTYEGDGVKVVNVEYV